MTIGDLKFVLEIGVTTTIAGIIGALIRDTRGESSRRGLVVSRLPSDLALGNVIEPEPYHC